MGKDEGENIFVERDTGKNILGEKRLREKIFLQEKDERRKYFDAGKMQINI